MAKAKKSAMQRLAGTIGVTEARLRRKTTPKQEAKTDRERKYASTLARVKEHEAQGKLVYWAPADAYVKERNGYRISMVRAGEDGHRPTGVWPNDGTGVMPYFFGPTLADAEKRCDLLNERQGVSREETLLIVSRSIARGKRS